jgi:hypothetical protein
MAAEREETSKKEKISWPEQQAWRDSGTMKGKKKLKFLMEAEFIP